MKWNRSINEIPPKTEVLVLTDLGEVLIAWRNRKNGRYLDGKALGYKFEPKGFKIE